MFYTLSKIFSLLIWPSNVITMLIAVGAVIVLSGRGGIRLQVWGRRSLAIGVMMLVLCGYGPVGTWLILPLEARFKSVPLPGEVAGIIMLGGFESPGLTAARRQLALNEGAERLTEGMRLARLRPQARIIFTGGEARLIGEGVGAADAVADYLGAIGFEQTRIVVEGQSRTTYENALLLRRMLNPKSGERYVLVTSSYHMPRSVGTFRQAGFEVVPWPVDYRTSGRRDLTRFGAAPPGGLERVDVAFKEWVGLLAYWISGRSAMLWPGPEAFTLRPISPASPAPPAAAASGAP